MIDVGLLNLNPKKNENEEEEENFDFVRLNWFTLNNDWSSFDFRLARTWICDETCFRVRDLPVRILI